MELFLVFIIIFFFLERVEDFDVLMVVSSQLEGFFMDISSLVFCILEEVVGDVLVIGSFEQFRVGSFIFGDVLLVVVEV